MTKEKRRDLRLFIGLVTCVAYMLISFWMSIATVANPEPRLLTWWHPALAIGLILSSLATLVFIRMNQKYTLTPDEEDLLNRFRRD